MYKKITASILIITLYNLTFYTSKLQAQNIGPVDQPNCADGPDGTEMTIFGDSRAWALAEIRVLIQLRRRFLDEIRKRK